MSHQEDFDTVFEMMQTARSVRRYTDQPIPRDVLQRVVQCGTFASNPRNTQPWHFIIVDDPATKQKFCDLISYRASEVEAVIPSLSTDAKKKMYQGAADLIRSMSTVPAIIFVCGVSLEYGPGFDSREMVLSSVFASAQNILVAARAAGLGAAYTTLQLHAQKETEQLLGVPEGTSIEATLPIGYPRTAFGPVNRKPLDEVVHWNSMGG